MVDKLSNVASTLVAAIVMITIIEMILPSGNNKKYVKFFSGVILVMIVITPMISALNSEINVEELVKQNQIEVLNVEQNVNHDYIYDSYNQNLKNDIVKRLEENGYKVMSIKLVTDKNTYEPSDLEVVLKHDDGVIQPVVIDVFRNSNSSLSNYDKEVIKTIINTNYGIKKSNIEIVD